MILGGRATLRSAIFMPARVAIRFNADLKRKSHQLNERGKASKLAITAIMRKLVLLANTLLRHGRKWAERPAGPRRILPPARARKHRSDGPKAHDAPTIKPDQPMSARRIRPIL